MANTEIPPNPAAPQNEGGKPDGGKRKIAGKYDSLEEAVEKGYVGLEAEFHAVKGEISAVKKLLEDALAAPDPAATRSVPIGQGRSDSPDSYGRYEKDDEDELKIDPAQFLANPAKILKQVEDRAYSRGVNASASLIANATVVSEFRARNSDLVKHEELVGSFMSKTDPRKPLATRLEDAGRMTREYLANLKSEWLGSNGRPPKGGEHVETPGGGRQAHQADDDEPAPEEGEEELLAHVRERNAWKASRFGVKS